MSLIIRAQKVSEIIYKGQLLQVTVPSSWIDAIISIKSILYTFLNLFLRTGVLFPENIINIYFIYPEAATLLIASFFNFFF